MEYVGNCEGHVEFYKKGGAGLMSNLFFLMGGIFFLGYAIRQKNNKARTIKYPVMLGILSILFAFFIWNHYVIGEIIVAVPAIILAFFGTRTRKRD